MFGIIATGYMCLGKKNILAETYGPGSKCFDAINRWTVRKIGSETTYYLDYPGCGCYQAIYMLNIAEKTQI